MMSVTVKLFAGAREAAGRSELVVGLPSGAAAGDLRSALASQWPALASLAERSMLAINAEYAEESTAILPGDEVALIPPVSGG